MALTTPITGNTSLKVGSSVTFSDATVGGVWSCDNTAVATIQSGTGICTGVSAGTANIIYTVGADSIAVTITVEAVTVTNGFNFNQVYNALRKRIGWQSMGDTTASGRYFEDFHTLCDTNILLDIQPNSTIKTTSDPLFATYLENKTRSVVLEAVNAIYCDKQIIDRTRLCFYRPDVMLVPQPVNNTDKFVGIKMTMAAGDFAVRFNSIELFFDKDVTFPIYLYNDMNLPPVYKMTVTAQAYNQVIVDLQNNAILNYLTPNNTKGGIRYFGYYQKDLGSARAIYYNIAYNQFHGCRLWAYSAPTYTDQQGNLNFQRNNIGANNLTYGLNLEVSSYVDSTNNIVANQHLLDEVIGNLMAVRVIKDIIYGYRSNGKTRVVQGNEQLGELYAQLNGIKAGEDIPYVMGLQDILSRAIMTAKKTFQQQHTTFVGIS